MRQVILDTETTGLSPAKGHRVIEIGCVEMINRQVTDKTFHHYINPERNIDAGAQKVHGISTDFLQDKPKFIDIVKDFIAFIDGAELIIHNAPFDVGFLDHELKRAGKQYKQIHSYSSVVDTLIIARKQRCGQRNSLDALCQHYQVDNSNRQLHGALLDAQLLAEVYLLLTGGQVQLFAQESQDKKAKAAGDIKRANTKREPLKVIQPDANELAAHQQYVQELEE